MGRSGRGLDRDGGGSVKEEGNMEQPIIWLLAIQLFGI